MTSCTQPRGFKGNCIHCSSIKVLPINCNKMKLMRSLIIELNGVDDKNLKICKNCCDNIVKDIRLELGNREKYCQQPLALKKEDPSNNLDDIYELHTNDKEYCEIKKLFLNSIKGEVSIIRIEKNINSKLLKKYHEKSAELCTNINQQRKYYFHGSHNQNYDSILKDGFDINLAKDGTLGKGIYFAEEASYSNSYTYNIKTDIGGIKNMLCCRVTFGKLGSNYKKSDAGGSKIYAVYSNDQCYPEFIIYYQ